MIGSSTLFAYIVKVCHVLALSVLAFSCCLEWGKFLDWLQSSSRTDDYLVCLLVNSCWQLYWKSFWSASTSVEYTGKYIIQSNFISIYILYKRWPATSYARATTRFVHFEKFSRLNFSSCSFVIRPYPRNAKPSLFLFHPYACLHLGCLSTLVNYNLKDFLPINGMEMHELRLSKLLLRGHFLPYNPVNFTRWTLSREKVLKSEYEKAEIGCMCAQR